MSDNYEIRAIKVDTLWFLYLCTRSACNAPATHYLVRKKSLPSDRAESRSRRCEACAQKDAESLRIPFPESTEFEKKMRRKLLGGKS